ncbi:MAG: cytochrome c [Hydrogenothermaceae bacterium]|nr:cytochrome c [Hydrogenothermaceae bacterium]
MKKLAILTAVLTTLSLSSNGETIKLETPPKDVGKYYPPNSKKFEFLNSMYAMSTAFTGVFTNIQENDWKNAEKWAKILRDNYLNIGKMVPEFDKGLKKDEIEALLKAVQNKDINNIKTYADAVGKSCAQCHQKYKITTKLIYHYPSFSMINIEDPVTKTSNEFEDHMKKMADSMKKMRIYLEDGKSDKAQVEGNNFIKRFKAVAESCSECHNNKLSEEIYYGKDVEEKLQALSKALQSKNKEEVYKNLNYISANNCSKCHNTHQTISDLKKLIK